MVKALLIVGCIFALVMTNRVTLVREWLWNRTVIALAQGDAVSADHLLTSYYYHSKEDAQKDERVLYGRGLLAIVQHDSATAMTIVEQVGSTGTDRARFVLLQSARLFMSEAKLSQALQTWKRARIGQNHALVAQLIEIADRYTTAGEGHLADEVYRTILDISPADDYVARQQALILSDVYGDYEKAFELILEVVNRYGSSSPNYVLVSDYSTLGDLSFRLGRLGEAAGWYERVLEKLPGNESAIAALARILYTQGRKEQAITLLEGASLTNPNSLAVLGSLYVASGRLDDAETVLQQSALDPRTDRDLAAWVHSMLAQIAEQRGDYWNAHEQLEQAFSLSHAPVYLIYLAELSARSGYLEQALSAYQQAQKLDWQGRYQSRIKSGLKALGVVTP